VNTTPVPGYPFSAVVGQDQLRLALILTAIAPRIGGVVVRGEKGTAKTTTVRAFSALLGDAPLVNLPIGATEDRVVGSLNVEKILTTGHAEYQPGLLAQADGGVLYVDEVNLLADHLVDALLDAAATGAVTIERDGISHTSSANFVLVGTMNPEEGELRPQLLDRFGLAVDVAASRDVEVRAEIMRRRLDYENDPHAFAERWAEEGAGVVFEFGLQPVDGNGESLRPGGQCFGARGKGTVFRQQQLVGEGIGGEGFFHLPPRAAGAGPGHDGGGARVGAHVGVVPPAKPFLSALSFRELMPLRASMTANLLVPDRGRMR